MTSLPPATHPSWNVEASRELQVEGRELIFALHGALRALRLYPLENQAVQNALAELGRAAAPLLRDQPDLAIRRVGDFFFVNDVRLRLDLASFATFGGLGRALDQHSIGEVYVQRGAPLAEWTTLLALINAEPAPDEPFARFAERLAQAGVSRVRVEERHDSADPLPQELARDVARRTYAHTVAVAREVMTARRMGKGVTLRRVKRAVQSIVDQVLNNQTSIMGMTTLRDFDQYTFTHSVNVCIFSVALGKRLGFEKQALYELGLGALMHDLGKMRLPLEVLNKPSALDEREWSLLREHPTEGLLALFEFSGLAEPPFRAMLISYEHHMKHDGSGYPASRRPRARSLFARIVAVADGFDAATTQRVYESEPGRPDRVLQGMLENEKWGMDPLLVRAFVGMTGIYPIGSLVVLDSYELAVVVSPNPSPNALHQPVVQVIYNSLGVPVDPPRRLDISETDAETGLPLHTIIKTTDPAEYGLHVSDYLA